MVDKPFRVVTRHGIAWAVRFATEEAAWGRILALNGGLADTQANRAKMLRLGYRIKLHEPAAYDLGAAE